MRTVSSAERIPVMHSFYSSHHSQVSELGQASDGGAFIMCVPHTVLSQNAADGRRLALAEASLKP